ncbi:MAG: NYN domain-containing protein [Planctomycetota bacterium]
MPVVIDGNNLLHAARTAETSTLLIGRSMLCDAIGRWAQRRNERVHMVFDGPAPPPPLAGQIGHPAIEVTYSGTGTSADSVLTEMLETDSAARRLLVVSSDREIVRAARRRRARSMGSEEFWRQVQRDLSRPPRVRVEPKEKEAGLRPDDVQRWLDEFGLR